MKTPILGSAYTLKSPNAAYNRCVNLYAEAVPEGGKEAGLLKRCPGLTLLAEVGSGPIRGLWRFGAYGYVVSGSELYRVDSFYTATLLGTVSGTGPVSMADNGTQLFVAANPDGYIYNASTEVFAEITDADFPGASQVGFLNGYFVFTEPNSQRIWVTSLYDGSAVDPLDFASAEGNPDNIVSMAIDHNELWLFGENSVEVWYNSGDTFPFTRISGAFVETGCLATHSVAKLDNSVFWLGSDQRGGGVVMRASGYNGVRVSTHAIEYAISTYGTVSDAVGFSYQQEGHVFYVLTFPTEGRTWCYDASTNMWHERAGWDSGEFVRHRSNNHMYFNRKNVVGDYDNGNLYVLDMDSFSDNGSIQKWLRSWRALPTSQNNMKATIHHALQLDCESGVGLSESQQGDDPVVMLRWSDDGGHTWSNTHNGAVGKIGEYGKRVIWRRLGITRKLRDRIYEISGTDPVDMAIMGAELSISQANT
jgi:hypothetical protein